MDITQDHDRPEPESLESMLGRWKAQFAQIPATEIRRICHVDVEDSLFRGVFGRCREFAWLVAEMENLEARGYEPWLHVFPHPRTHNCCDGSGDAGQVVVLLS